MAAWSASRRAIQGTAIAALVMLAAGCATAPSVPKMPEAGAAGAGIQVRVISPIGFPSYGAGVVYFATVCADTAPCEDKLRATSYSKDGRAYLLDAPPAEYRAVAASFSTMGAPDTYIVYFPEPLAEQTRVRLADAGFQYAGSYVIDSSLNLCPDEADALQIRTAERIEPGTAKCGILKTILGKLARTDMIYIAGSMYPISGVIHHYRGVAREARRSAEDEQDFLDKASIDLAPGGWRIPAAGTAEAVPAPK